MNRPCAKQTGRRPQQREPTRIHGRHCIVLRPLLVAILPMLAITACSSQRPATRSAQAGPAACKPSQLAFHLDDGNGRFNGMSHSGTLLVLRNAGTLACSIPAQPTVSFRDANRQVLAIAARVSPEKPPAATVSRIVLAPGTSATSEMRWVSGNVYDDGHCESPASITLMIGRRTIPAEFHGHLCGAGGQPSMYTLAPFRPMATPAPATATNTLTYTCDDGRIVRAAYPDTDTAVLSFDRQTHRLHIAVSADGARYVGDRWQWWSKGMHDARLAPLQPGESYASAEGVSCRAP